MLVGQGADFVASGRGGVGQQPLLQGAAPAGFEAVPLVGAGGGHAESAFLGELDQYGERQVHVEVVPHRSGAPEGLAEEQSAAAGSRGRIASSACRVPPHAWLLPIEIATSAVPSQLPTSPCANRTRSATPRASAL
ncbi:hypothetical protein AB0L88_21385 [Saccharopolyspora shandongensis]|uniref:hypothetical protein n=1 Tax=Saccharopolyspora shandongensis TaxID=418495 RepID=UPI003418C8C0